MEYAVGVVLALLVALMAARAGLDRDRAFYPTVLIVIASYYDLFAIVAGSLPALGLETLSLAAFAGLALVGFRRNLWIVVVALFAHGGLDLVHGRLIANPGVPAWWPMFCLTYDWTAALGLAWTLCRPFPADVGVPGGDAAPERFPLRIRRAVSTELLAAREAEKSGNWAASFHHLERAHILGQASTAEHVRVHGRMLGWAVRRGDAREAVAQVLRLAGAATKTLFGLVPTGNPGGGNVAPFQSFPVPDDLGATLARARPPAMPRRVSVMLAIGVLLACGLAVRAAVAAPSVSGLPSTPAQVESSDFGRGMRALVVSRRVGPKPSAFDALWAQTQSDLAARYAGATHLIAPGGGHFVHRDQGDWFVSAVRRFYAASGERP